MPIHSTPALGHADARADCDTPGCDSTIPMEELWELTDQPNPGPRLWHCHLDPDLGQAVTHCPAHYDNGVDHADRLHQAEARRSGRHPSQHPGGLPSHPHAVEVQTGTRLDRPVVA